MSSALSWEQACRQGDEAQVSRLLPDQPNRNMYFGMTWAAEHNHLHLVQFFIDKGADNWNEALTAAAYSGNLQLAQLFIDKGANDWDDALAYAAEGGHLHLVQFFIDKGADDWNCAIVHAAIGGCLPLVRLFIDKGADDWNSALQCATLGRHLHLVQFFIECGATVWSSECFSLLTQHSDVIIAIFQRGKVPRQTFAQHPVFEQQIIAFLEWQQQAGLQVYNTCLLPHELCALVVAY
jgi:ankyrin repeat protein